MITRYDPSLAVRQLLETGQYNLLASLATGEGFHSYGSSSQSMFTDNGWSWNLEHNTCFQCGVLSKKLVAGWRYICNRLSASTTSISSISSPSLSLSLSTSAHYVLSSWWSEQCYNRQKLLIQNLSDILSGAMFNLECITFCQYVPTMAILDPKIAIFGLIWP